jgi:phosphoribosylanthranilate isomerase
MRTRVKVCGFTCADNARSAAFLGVDAIGLVFYPPSSRHVDIEAAKKIVAGLPAFVSVVGLFVDADEASIREVLKHVAIDCIQFHGDETPDACRLYGKPYIKAVRMRNDSCLEQVSKDYFDASGLLLDAYDSGAKGGTGSCFDWNLIPEHSDLPLILAGGLDVSNARKAIEQVRPYAVDVSSGVEFKKGIKDTAKMAAFLSEINEADRLLR